MKNIVLKWFLLVIDRIWYNFTHTTEDLDLTSTNSHFPACYFLPVTEFSFESGKRLSICLSPATQMKLSKVAEKDDLWYVCLPAVHYTSAASLNEKDNHPVLSVKRILITIMKLNECFKFGKICGKRSAILLLLLSSFFLDVRAIWLYYFIFGVKV